MASPASNGSPAAGSSTPQTRACHVCTVSKAKCSRPESGNGACERCSRLGKKCIPGPAAKKKPRRPRTNPTAQLAEKLDSIVSLLSDRQAAALPDNGALKPPTASPGTPGWAGAAGPLVDRSLAPPALLPAAPARSAPAANHLPWGASADRKLQFFQSDMAPYFPFVAIPAGTTADGLRAARPALHDSIMVVLSYQNVSRQAELRAQFIRSCTDQIFVHGRKSLDLIQGILIFAAWYNHCFLPSPQLMNMVQLAVALVFDMGLHRTQRPSEGQDISADGWKTIVSGRAKAPRTLEERRAFLGLFSLTRGLAANVNKIEPLKNTPYVAECCLEIERCQEYPSDKFLVFQVRLQNVADTAAVSFPHDGVDYWSELGSDAVHMLVKSFQSGLERFRLAQDPELAQSPLFRIHLAIAAIHNTEIALRGEPAQTAAKAPNPIRLALLMACLQSTREFFAEWLALPSGLYYRLPITVFALAAHATIVLGTLNFFQCDGWDLDAVRQISPMLPILDSLAQKYEEASRETDDGEMSGCSPFLREGTKMQKLKEWYEARLPGGAPRRAGQGGGEGMELCPPVEFELDELFWAETTDWIGLDAESLLSGVVADAGKM